MRVYLSLLGLDVLDLTIETGGGEDVDADSGYTTSTPISFNGWQDECDQPGGGLE